MIELKACCLRAKTAGLLYLIMLNFTFLPNIYESFIDVV